MSNPIQISIDLHDVFFGDDEYPNETLEEAIRRQVVAQIASEVKSQALKPISALVNGHVENAVAESVSSVLPKMIEEVLQSEYTVVGKWGEKGKTTTLRNEIVETLTDQF